MEVLEAGPGEKEEVTCGNAPESTSEAERKLLRKLDLFLMPIIMLLYLVAFLDRANIGNAAIAGMVADLKLEGSQLNVATSLLYVTYIIGEPPATILLKIVGPSKLIPAIVCSWSIITITTAFAQSYKGLIVIRLLLGLAESGLFPCLTLYLTQFYYRNEQSKRIALLFTSSALSGAIGGLLAYGLVQIQTSTLKGWQWLFVVEGIFSFLVGLLSYFLLPDCVETAYFLRKEEKALAIQRRIDSSAYARTDEKFSWSQVSMSLKDPKMYLSSISQFGADTALYGFSTFLPVIIKALGYGQLQAQLLTIPVYVLASVIFVICAIVADRIKRRMIFVVCGSCLPLVGYALLASRNLSTGVHYFACFLAGAGIYTTVGMNVVVLSINQAGHFKRATSLGFQLAFGNSSGILAGQLYQSKWAPDYTIGHAVTLGCVAMCLVAALLHWLYLCHKNHQRDKLSQREIEDILKKVHNESELGDFSPLWRYLW